MSARRAWLALLAGAVPLVGAEDKVVELPPMVVAESAQTPPWLYLRTPYCEYLSRCSNGVTRDFVQGDLRQFQLLRVFIPDSLLLKTDLPPLVVLDRIELKPADDTIAQDMTTLQSQRHEEQQRADGLLAAPMHVQTLLNLRVDDRDSSGLFAYLDEKKYDGDKMVLTPGYVRFMLERHVPDLPGWFVEGAVEIFSESVFTGDPILVKPFNWISYRETQALVRNPDFPRALLPMNELLSADVFRAEGDRAAARRDVFRAQVALFFRWAIDPRNGMRDAYFRLVERASREAVNEQIFEECFGFGYAEMRDRLSDYLPLAVKDSFRLDPGRLERPKVGDARKATKEEVARLLGEWERLEINYVKARHPEFAGRFAQEARRTLLRGYELGDREPTLLASLGLCEIDAGNESAAPFYLDRAVAARVGRPRAHYESARLLFMALTRNLGKDGKLTVGETEQVVAPLRVALTQAPLLPEAVTLFAGTWLVSAGNPTERDLFLLEQTARSFPARPLIAYGAALVLARNGRADVARDLCAQTLRFPLDDALRARFTALKDSFSQNAK